MKVQRSKPIFLLLLSLVALALTGCGRNSQNRNNPNMNGQLGFPTGGVGGIPVGQGGCAPLQPGMPIPIALQGAMFNSAALQAQPGQAVIGGAGAPVGNYYLQGQSGEGAIQIGLQIQNLLQAGPAPVTGQGVLIISQLRFQAIMQRLGIPMMGMWGPQMGGMTQICASGVAIDLSHYNTRLYNGRVTLIISTQAGQFPEEVYF